MATEVTNCLLLADLAGTRRESTFAQKELSIERHQKTVLQSKVTTLEDQVVYQKKEMKELKGDAKEKLTSAGDHVRQTRHEVANLKAKVRISRSLVFLLFRDVHIIIIICQICSATNWLSGR